MVDHCEPSNTYAVAIAQEEGQGEEKKALTITTSIKEATSNRFFFFIFAHPLRQVVILVNKLFPDFVAKNVAFLIKCDIAAC